ncbi:hypothetical protein EVA_12604 [gut metagenome]|uniref:Uncharacterized protein n=1 Tax=gut metagenome TaxID=749906 RepID=J9FWA7_9ZZZZ
MQTRDTFFSIKLLNFRRGTEINSAEARALHQLFRTFAVV